MSRIKIGKKIGEGGMGKVFLSTYVIDPKTNKKISAAVKQVVPSKMNMDEIVLQAQLSRLPNCESHIACFYDIFTDPRTNDYQIVMEYIKGKELWDYAHEHKGQFTQVELVDIFKQALQGLSFIHSHGIAHADIKLENFMMDNKRKLKFIDFGFGCNEKSCPSSPAWHGTTFLTPPEGLKLQNKKNLKSMQAADIWALASMFVELIVYAGSLRRTDDFGMDSASLLRVSKTNWRASKHLQSLRLKRPLNNKIYKVIDGMMRIDPNNRLKASQALKLL